MQTSAQRNRRLLWVMILGALSLPVISCTDAFFDLAKSPAGLTLIRSSFYAGIGAVIVPPVFFGASVLARIGIFFAGVAAYIVVAIITLIIALQTGYAHIRF